MHISSNCQRAIFGRFFSFLFLAFFAVCASAQPPEKSVKVIVAPDHSNWEYKKGEPAQFTITVMRNGNPVKNANLHYEVMPEKMPARKKEDLVLKEGKITIDGGSLPVAGFLRCTATITIDGQKYTGMATAGFEPLGIQPTAVMPADFVQYWEAAKAAASKVPLDARVTLMPERCTEKVNVYQVSLQNFSADNRLYGILCVPKKEGKYPAILRVPGAGVRPYGGYVDGAENGFITFEIGIHGIPVTMEPGVYNDLRAGALKGYMFYGLNDKDQYYYKRVYLGCVRANDFIFSLPQFDGQNLAVTGGSQGGALSITTAALDPRVKYLAAFYPALSDLTGYLHGRAGGWPHMFVNRNAPPESKEAVATAGYYDVVNFARTLKIPGYYSWGFNDETCPPTSTYSAYNVITAPKTLVLALDTGHWTYPEQTKGATDWLFAQLLKK